ncbi:MAG: TA system VapC family ribonuclease toxin [Burkholderiales bacterium]
MILLDANILIYAYHPRSPQHKRARSWLEREFAGKEFVRLPWSSILAFIRISTNPRAFEDPLAISEASAIVSSWLDLPMVSTIEPGERYWQILRELMVEAQVSGPLVSDAALAALTIENGGTLCTTDRDFSRFSGLNVLNPLSI